MSDRAPKYRGILSRGRRSLWADTAGNTMAMSAAALFPLVGLVGGGLDMSRLYIVKTRLQSACDAGALTGRRVMGNSAWSANSGNANTQAQRMFDVNFADGSYGTTGRTRGFTETNGVVNGTASAVVPMTLTSPIPRLTSRANRSCLRRSTPNTLGNESAKRSSASYSPSATPSSYNTTSAFSGFRW